MSETGKRGIATSGLCFNFTTDKMVSVNCSVFNRSSDKTFFPWSIVSLGVPDITVQQFYDEKVLHCLIEQSKQELNWHFQENSRIL